MNKNILSNAIIFTVGAAIGSVVTWKLVKTKYEQIAQEEIESVRAVYEESEEDDEEDTADRVDTVNKKYKKIVSEYATYDEENEEEDEEMIEPYVIIPEEFDENGYETVTLYYFADGVVTDTSYEVVENVDELIGEDSLNHFGEYGDHDTDSVFVRNDNLLTDFEILKDARRFSEVE